MSAAKKALLFSRPELWTPAEATNSLWIDFSDQSTITISTGISQINDKSGNGRNFTQATGAQQPIVASAALNGLDVGQFDGSDDLLVTAASWEPYNPDVSVLAVVKLTNGALSYPQIYRNNPLELRCVSTDDKPAYTDAGTNNGAGETGAAVAGTTSSILNTWSVVVGVYSPGDWNLWQDGTSRHTAVYNLGASSNTVRHIGARPGPGLPFGGQIAEIIEWFSKDTAERQVREGYVFWKWGLQALIPLGHPYKDAPPYRNA